MISPTEKLSLYNYNNFSFHNLNQYQVNLPPLPLVQVSVNKWKLKAIEGEKKINYCAHKVLKGFNFICLINDYCWKNIIQRTRHLEVGHLTHGLTWEND